MFGGTIFRIAKYAVIGAITLTLGTQLITSVNSIVIAYRLGNNIPLILVFLVTLGVLRIAGSSMFNEPVKMITNVLGWTATIFLSVTVFIIGLENGLLFSIVGTASVTILCAVVRNPNQIVVRLNEGFNHKLSLDTSMAARGIDSISDDELWVYVDQLASKLKALHIPLGAHNSIIEIFQQRVEWSVSLTHLNDMDALVVDTSLVPIEDVVNILELPETHCPKVCSHTLTKAILALPFIDARFGITFTDYEYMTDPNSVSLLIDSWAPGTTIFPSKPGISALVPKELATGLTSASLHSNELRSLILERKLPIKRVEEQNDDT